MNNNRYIQIIDEVYNDLISRRTSTAAPPRNEGKATHDKPLAVVEGASNRTAIIENPVNERSFIPANADICGSLHIESLKSEVHGRIRGNLDAPAHSELLIGKTAIVSGNIKADRLIVEGLVEGDITAAQVFMLPGSSVRGALRYVRTLRMEDGAELCGKVEKI